MLKWGDLCNDVQLILKQTKLCSATNGGGTTLKLLSPKGNLSSDNKSPETFSGNSLPGRDIKKSLTFSGGVISDDNRRSRDQVCNVFCDPHDQLFRPSNQSNPYPTTQLPPASCSNFIASFSPDSSVPSFRNPPSVISRPRVPPPYEVAAARANAQHSNAQHSNYHQRLPYSDNVRHKSISASYLKSNKRNDDESCLVDSSSYSNDGNNMCGNSYKSSPNLRALPPYRPPPSPPSKISAHVYRHNETKVATKKPCAQYVEQNVSKLSPREYSLQNDSNSRMDPISQSRLNASPTSRFMPTLNGSPYSHSFHDNTSAYNPNNVIPSAFIKTNPSNDAQSTTNFPKSSTGQSEFSRLSPCSNKPTVCSCNVPYVTSVTNNTMRMSQPSSDSVQSNAHSRPVNYQQNDAHIHQQNDHSHAMNQQNDHSHAMNCQQNDHSRTVNHQQNDAHNHHQNDHSQVMNHQQDDHSQVMNHQQNDHSQVMNHQQNDHSQAMNTQGNNTTAHDSHATNNSYVVGNNVFQNGIDDHHFLHDGKNGTTYGSNNGHAGGKHEFQNGTDEFGFQQENHTKCSSRTEEGLSTQVICPS